MKIYTKTGDQGETSLWGGSRVLKNHPRVECYGTLDEANSMIGLALSFVPSHSPLQNLVKELSEIQSELFQVGAELATPSSAKNSIAGIEDSQIMRLETQIDAHESGLPALQNFILPSGSSIGSALHLARTIVRRAERQCVELSKQEALRPELIRYLNRLSDYLFVAARASNHGLNNPETPWIAKK